MTLDGNVRGSPVSRKSAAGDHVASHDGDGNDDKEEGGGGRGRSPGNQQEGAGGGGGGGGGSSRRVSFQLDRKVSRQHSQSSSNSRRSGHRATSVLNHPPHPPHLPPPPLTPPSLNPSSLPTPPLVLLHRSVVAIVTSWWSARSFLFVVVPWWLIWCPFYSVPDLALFNGALCLWLSVFVSLSLALCHCFSVSVSLSLPWLSLSQISHGPVA